MLSLQISSSSLNLVNNLWTSWKVDWLKARIFKKKWLKGVLYFSIQIYWWHDSNIDCKLVVWSWANSGFLVTAIKMRFLLLVVSGKFCISEILYYFQVLRRWSLSSSWPFFLNFSSPSLFLPFFTYVLSASALHPPYFPGHPPVPLRWFTMGIFSWKWHHSYP